MKTGVECEYFLIAPDGTAISDGADTQAKPCYDQQALMRRYDVIAEICDAMIALGWKPYQNDHEDANGQFEMNWEYDTALRDRRQARLLQVHGQVDRREARPARDLHAEAVPATSPAMAATRTSRCGTRPARTCSRTRRASSACRKEAYHFIGGVMHSAEALAAITNPTVNSYKRINAPRTLSGATWSPNTVTYGGNNRTHMIRIPDAGRFELRLADGAANPYLLQAALLAAGLDGIAQQARSGQAPRHRHVHRGPHGEGRQEAAAQPARCAARARQARACCKAAFGEDVVASYLKLQARPTGTTTPRHLTDWERADDARLLMCHPGLVPGPRCAVRRSRMHRRDDR